MNKKISMMLAKLEELNHNDYAEVKGIDTCHGELELGYIDCWIFLQHIHYIFNATEMKTYLIYENGQKKLLDN